MVFDGEAIGGGGNSGFQALNLVVSMFGAKRIVLIGFDMNDQGGLHFYGRNRWSLANNPDHTNFRRWIDNMSAAAIELARRGLQVVNVSPNSSLTCFPKRSIEDALQGWA